MSNNMKEVIIPSSHGTGADLRLTIWKTTPQSAVGQGRPMLSISTIDDRGTRRKFGPDFVLIGADIQRLINEITSFLPEMGSDLKET